jgi:hypothetical protein
MSEANDHIIAFKAPITNLYTSTVFYFIYNPIAGSSE